MIHKTEANPLNPPYQGDFRSPKLRYQGELPIGFERPLMAPPGYGNGAGLLFPPGKGG
jgi:hypothetical protein